VLLIVIIIGYIPGLTFLKYTGIYSLMHINKSKFVHSNFIPIEKIPPYIIVNDTPLK